MEGKWFSLGYYYPGIAWRKYQRLKCGLDDRGLEYWRKEMVFLLFVISYFIWAQHSLLLMITRIYFLGGKSGRNVRLTLHLHLVPTLRITEAITPLHP